MMFFTSTNSATAAIAVSYGVGGFLLLWRGRSRSRPCRRVFYSMAWMFLSLSLESAAFLSQDFLPPTLYLLLGFIPLAFGLSGLSVILKQIQLGGAILRNAPGGVILLRLGKGQHLQVEACSDAATRDMGQNSWASFLDFKIPCANSINPLDEGRSLREAVTEVMATGKEIHGQEIHRGATEKQSGCWTLQDIVRINSSHALVSWSNISALKRAQFRYQKLANVDPLTKAFNRNILERLGSIPFAGVIVVDLNQFKSVNDTFGHKEGDLLLKKMASRLWTEIASQDRLIRMGGDEFVILVRSFNGLAELQAIAKRIHKTLQHPYELTCGGTVKMDASLGIAQRGHGGIDKLLKAGDLAMYSAKNAGGGVEIWSEALERKELRRKRIEQALRDLRGNHDSQMTLQYQPIVSLHNRKHICGMEALVRWNHPTLGAISPGEFIPIAESSREICHISDWVLVRVMRRCRLFSGIPVSVNLSPWDLEQIGFAESFKSMCDRFGISPGDIALEVTERPVRDFPFKHYSDSLRMLGSLGVSLKVDDFGVGEASPGRLMESAWADVKIDASLVPFRRSDKRKLAICSALITLVKSFSIHATVEGIETEEQAAIAKELGADAGQGYLFARPMDLEDALHWIKKRT